MIIRKFLFQKFHHPRHDKIEDVVENTGGNERNHRGLGRRDLFCDREHFHIGNGKGQRRILDQRNNLIGDRRQNPFHNLRQNNADKRLSLRITKKLCCLVLSTIHRNDAGAVDFCKIGAVV